MDKTTIIRKLERLAGLLEGISYSASANDVGDAVVQALESVDDFIKELDSEE